MENVRLTIAVGVARLIYRRAAITVWQENHESPFSFEFTLAGKTIRGKTRTRLLATAARRVLDRVDLELRTCRHNRR